ncbi:MAG: UDP-N-acetylglucosamine 2-epimerase (non-hydrolyzing) [Acidobacteriia bacterium]|nr:UDP-N-acetylglucosamine 2-epimerase (non-hydrolyzing) [Terriglobia bacterium]
MHILHVVGARPNFMKAAPVVRALGEHSSVRQTIVHTGQHYDANMSDVFFQQLAIPAPDVNLQVGSGSHAQQTAEIISRFEPVVVERKPDLVLVYGDVNSTVAAALVCAKLLVKVGHVEAGLRSFDRTMPEEVNRLLTDQVADLLFTPSRDGNENLAREGVAPEKVHLVGNVMIDTLVRMLPVARQQIPKDLPEQFVLVTLHRPSNVDDLPWLAKVIATLCEIAKDVPVVFPVHPRTRKNLADAGLQPDGVRMIDPLPYIEFLGSQTRAALVITDSGGIQEETTYLGVPCITVRENTERPITIDLGTNHLVGRSVERIRSTAYEVLNGPKKRAAIPPLWDGHAAERIAAIIAASRF